MRSPRLRKSIQMNRSVPRALRRRWDLGPPRASLGDQIHLLSDAAAVVMPANTSLAKLLAAHILRDGELVIFILRPSLWFIVLSCLRFLVTAVVLLASLHFFSIHAMISHGTVRSLAEFGTSAIFARLTWSTLQWMSRLYILTDLRVLGLTGVFNVNIFDCPLRKVARTRLIRSNPERVTGIGSIEIIPQDETLPIGQWQMVARPVWVREQIVATIKRAKQGVRED